MACLLHIKSKLHRQQITSLLLKIISFVKILLLLKFTNVIVVKPKKLLLKILSFIVNSYRKTTLSIALVSIYSLTYPQVYALQYLWKSVQAYGAQIYPKGPFIFNADPFFFFTVVGILIHCSYLLKLIKVLFMVYFVCILFSGIVKCVFKSY